MTAEELARGLAACRTCRGDGVVRVAHSQVGGFGIETEVADCAECNATGIKPWALEVICNYTAQVRREATERERRRANRVCNEVGYERAIPNATLAFDTLMEIQRRIREGDGD